MTREDAVTTLKDISEMVHKQKEIEKSTLYGILDSNNEPIKALDMAIKALEQEPCEDAISRKAVLDGIEELKKSPWATDKRGIGFEYLITEALEVVADLCVKREPPVTPKPKTGHCKDCKYFEYNSMAKVDGIPLIVAHEICKKWGDGCKTNENGYCFLFEPQESEDKE